MPHVLSISQKDPRVGLLLRVIDKNASTVQELSNRLINWVGSMRGQPSISSATPPTHAGLDSRYSASYSVAHESHQRVPFVSDITKFRRPRKTSIPTWQTVDQLRDLREQLEGLNHMALEEELAQLIVAIGENPDRAGMVARYLGWDGQGGATLQAVGDEWGISRERVRQVSSRALKRLRGRSPFLPVLDRAAIYVNQEIPNLAEDLEVGLARQGISERAFRLEGLQSAMRVLGRGVSFMVQGTGASRLALGLSDPTPLAHVGGAGTPERGLIASDIDVPRAILRIARRSVERWGVCTVADVTAEIGKLVSTDITSKIVARVLMTRPGFLLLDEVNAWFSLADVPRNRLLNQVEKVLAVAPRIEISELRAAVSRSHRMQGFAPPRRVLLELCRQTTGYSVEGTTVVVDPASDSDQVLGRVESTMVEILRECGPVMERSELERLCQERGIIRSTFYIYLDYSPVITKYARGVYGLPGVEISPGTIESLSPKRRWGRTLSDYGWRADGTVWVAYIVSAGMLANGLVTIPASMKAFVQGDFDLKTPDGASIGTLVVKENSAWGLGPFYRRRGGEIGDALLVILDSRSREATVQIGGAELLDNLTEATA
jgi:hypothetical protein